MRKIRQLRGDEIAMWRNMGDSEFIDWSINLILNNYEHVWIAKIDNTMGLKEGDGYLLMNDGSLCDQNWSFDWVCDSAFDKAEDIIIKRNREDRNNKRGYSNIVEVAILLILDASYDYAIDGFLIDFEEIALSLAFDALKNDPDKYDIIDRMVSLTNEITNRMLETNHLINGSESEDEVSKMVKEGIRSIIMLNDIEWLPKRLCDEIEDSGEKYNYGIGCILSLEQIEQIEEGSYKELNIVRDTVFYIDDIQCDNDFRGTVKKEYISEIVYLPFKPAEGMNKVYNDKLSEVKILGGV